MRLKNLVLVFCFLCAAAAVWLTWELVLSSAAGNPAAAGTAGPRNREVPDTPTADRGGTIEPDEEMTARAADREAIEPASRAEPGTEEDDYFLPGTVLYHVVAADRVQRIDFINVRFVNDDRFACHYGSAAGEVHLSQGVYTCIFLLDGCDPAIVEDVEVRSGETTDLGLIVMQAGIAVIEGIVNAHTPNLDEPVIVELYGTGRRPCLLCRGGTGETSVCSCGFTSEKTTRVLKYDRRFSFDGLAGGTYFLHSRIFSARHGDQRRIELERGGYAAVAVDLVPEVSVPFLLLDESGKHFFSGVMEAEQKKDGIFEVELEAIKFTFRRDGRLIAEATAIPSFAGTYWEEICFEEQSPIDAIFGPAGGRDGGRPRPIDRARGPGDVLIPVFSRPGLETVTLQVRMHGNSFMTLSPLPALRLEAEVTCCGLTSGAFALDLGRWTGAAVPVTLKKE